MDKRYDFLFLFDVQDGNPNGDPDAGNLPRVDPETGHGLVTDVCLKRKIRNFVGQVYEEQPPYEIYVKEKAILNNQHARAYRELDKDPKNAGQEEINSARNWMCRNFFDIRAFGAVMTLGVNCGQVRGPVQLSFSRSLDPVVSLEHSVTRCAVATEKEANSQHGDNRTMGRKFTVPYGLYRAYGFINPFLAEQTGFSDEDREILFKALENAFQFDQSAARPAGSMNARGLIVFEHDTKLGQAPSHKLFEAVHVGRKDDSRPARGIEDYQMNVDQSIIPDGIQVYRRI